MVSTRRLAIPLLTVLLAVSACASPTASPARQPAPSAPTSAPASVPGDYPVSLIDDAERTVTIEAEPDRIVSLAPSNTEIVCALDACDALVGVPEFRDGHPPEVLETIADMPVVVTFGPIDREAVIATAPDLVLAAGNELTPSDDIAALAELGLDVLVLYPESLAEVAADVTLVGAALGRAEEAASVVANMEERIGEVREVVADRERPRTFYEVSIFEGTIYTAGEDSFLASLIDEAGGEPIVGDALSTAISIEALVAADPELILLGDATYDPTITAESVAQRPGWGEMTAVRDGRVVPVSEDLLITRPSHRIVDGLVALARHIHADAFEGS
jgi:iron complex transport system substrate-binding protein